MPIHVNALALGLPPADRELFVEWTLTMTSTAVAPDERVAASRAVSDYLAPLVAERRARPRDDLLGALVLAQVPEDGDDDRDGSVAWTDDGDDRGGSVAHDPISDTELVDFTRLLMAAGTVTVHRAYGILLYALLTHPDQLAAVRDDRRLVPQAVEEALRWEQPLAHFGRLATRDTRLGDVAVAAGCPVTVDVGAANHDPAVWPDPERFDIFRAPRPHLTFGFGRHRCLGIHLARTELRVMLEATLDRCPNLRLDPAHPTRLTGLQIRMVSGLPVEWDVPG